jgi:uncharacterized membrane protein YphA (DoxX/SURF4 family)
VPPNWRFLHIIAAAILRVVSTPNRCAMTNRYLLSGRILFAIAITGFGAICLFYTDFVHSLQPVPESMPGYRVLAVATGLLLASCGMAIAADFKVYPAAVVLAALLVLWIVLLHLPGAFVEPALLRSPFWIRTFECLALGSTALILAGMARRPAREQWIYAGRIGFGISLPVFAVLHFIYPESVAALIPAWYPWPLLLAYLSGAGHLAAGVAIATGVWSRLAAIVAGFMFALWALTLHLPRVIAHPVARSAENPAGYGGDRPELTSFCVCIAFWGAAWIVAGTLSGREGSAAKALNANASDEDALITG